MKKIRDYEILEKISETTGTLVCRGQKVGEKNTVIIKILKTLMSSPSEIARFKQEYENIKSIDYNGIIKTYEIIDYESRFAIVLEDFNGVSLNKILDEIEVFDINSFLHISIKISKAIGEIHKKNIIHRAIRPDNILFNQNTGMVKITNFGISTLLTHENGEIFNADVIQETLLYNSPEQTGRMNHIVDYRTDLYSLGVTFYKMLSGTTPFESNNPLTIIHSHIAREPAPLVELRTTVPVIISDIIMKLMSKNAEDRYQNAFGLMADLLECCKKYEMTEKIEPFELAKYDISNRFIIPQKLFGREKEMKILMSAFERISSTAPEKPEAGNCEIILVSGSPGIGKSALINELDKLITEKKGYFLSGKYEQFRKDKPYSAIIQAFQKLLRQILSESDEMIKKIRKDILKALGQNGKIMIDIIPDLELIIGKQPDVPKLAPNEEKNRFNIVFERFVRTFTKKEHPIVLFLDDLQWADPASLQLIGNIITSSNMLYLLIAGSYRDNEVNAEHPLTGTLLEIEKAGTRVNRIILSELGKDNIKDLVIHLLKCSEERGDSLAQLICKKTGGNPFFINEFLHTLYIKKLIQADSQLGWNWDIKEVDKMHITDNVVEFLSNRINELPENIQRILKICSCFGNRFDPEIISLLLAKSIEETLSDFTEAIDEGFINITGNVYIFHHDRIQEAAYSLIPDEEKSKLHYRIGKLTLERTEKSEFPNKKFFIVDHLNLGAALITDRKEREELAQMNCRNGIAAKRSAAYVPALKYFETAMDLLDKKSWENLYTLSLAIYSLAAETASLVGDYDRMERYASDVLDNAVNVYDTISVYEVRMTACRARLLFQEAIDIAIDVLKKLNYPLPPRPGRLKLIFALLKIIPALSIKKIDSLINLPVMTDSRMLAIQQIFSHLGVSAYYVSPELFAYIVVKETELSIKYGHCPMQCFNYTGMAMVMSLVLGDYKAGYKLGNLSLKLVEKLKARRYEAETRFTYNSLIAHWTDPWKKIMPQFIRIYHKSLETGNLEWAGYSLTTHCYYGFLFGKRLPELEQEISGYYKLIKSYKHAPSIGFQSILWQVVLNLLEKSESPTELKGKAFNEKEFISQWKTRGTGSLFVLFYVNRIILCFLFYEYRKALKDAENINAYKDSMRGFGLDREIFFYSSLVMLTLYPDASKQEKRKYKKYIRQSLKKMRKWKKNSPVIIEYRYYIILAEVARVNGRHRRAEYLYDKAIKTCKQDDYLIAEAITNELACKYYLSRGRKSLAGSYLLCAYHCYAQWGAIAKLNHLKRLYPELLSPVINPLVILPGVPGRPDAGTKSFDLIAVMKAARTISGEIVLGKLLSGMMKIVLELAGARRGVMILEEKNSLFVEAEGSVENEIISVLKSVPLEDYRRISAAMVNYVARTKKMVILNNAIREGEFTDDPYVIKEQPKSVLCMAILNRGKLSGILYLENNLSTGVFTEERLEILRVLSSQIAVSINNARLYANLEDEVVSRTMALQKANQKLKELSLNDPLTNLRNRRYVYRFVSESSSNFLKNKAKLLNSDERRDLNIKDKVFGIYMIDIDHFKTVNDMYGHQAGDKVLITISNVLRQMIRNEDTIVRWGGEEFLIILQYTSADYVKVFSRKVLEAVRNISFTILDNTSIHKTCSVGCAKMPFDANHPDLLNLEQIINLSDFAMYMAKENGRNKAAHIELKNNTIINEENKQYLFTLSKNTAINENIIKFEYVE